MGGQGSDMFEYFKLLILQGLIAARKHSEKIVSLVDIMRAGKKSIAIGDMTYAPNFMKVTVVFICIDRYIFILDKFRLPASLFYIWIRLKRSSYEIKIPYEHDRGTTAYFSEHPCGTINQLPHYKAI